MSRLVSDVASPHFLESISDFDCATTLFVLITSLSRPIHWFEMIGILYFDFTIYLRFWSELPPFLRRAINFEEEKEDPDCASAILSLYRQTRSVGIKLI